MSHRYANEPTALYRLYDAQGVLLYLGISWNPDERMKLHALDKHWLHLVTRRTIEWYPDRASALAVEVTATASEKPLHDSSWRRRQSDEKPQWLDREGEQAVINGLATEIEQGQHQPGVIILTGSVASRYGVARPTAKNAMEELAERGLLAYVIHGRFRVLPTS